MMIVSYTNIGIHVNLVVIHIKPKANKLRRVFFQTGVEQKRVDQSSIYSTQKVVSGTGQAIFSHRLKGGLIISLFKCQKTERRRQTYQFQKPYGKNIEFYLRLFSP